MLSSSSFSWISLNKRSRSSSKSPSASSACSKLFILSRMRLRKTMLPIQASDELFRRQPRREAQYTGVHTISVSPQSRNLASVFQTQQTEIVFNRSDGPTHRSTPARAKSPAKKKRRRVEQYEAMGPCFVRRMTQRCVCRYLCSVPCAYFNLS